MTDQRGSYPPEQWFTESREREAAAWRATGETPPWERVYNNGKDVTDHPELWPEPIPVGRARRYRKRR